MNLPALVPVLLAALAPQALAQPPLKKRLPPRVGRITLPPRAPKPGAQPVQRVPNDPDQFYRDVIDLRRSKTLKPVDEERLLRSLAVHYDDPARMALGLSLRCKNDLLFGLMKVIDRYGTATHAKELHFQVLSRPMGRVTGRVIKTVVAKSGAEAKARLFEYLTSRYSPARKLAAELLLPRIAGEDTPQLLTLSRDRKADIRRKVIGILGGIDAPEVRERLLQIMRHDPALAGDACTALIAQGAVVVPELEAILHKPARGRVFGYAAFALVRIESAVHAVYLDASMTPNLIRELRGDDPLLRATSAIALGTLAYRSADWNDNSRHDRRIVDGLLTLVAPEEFISGLRLLQPVANSVLVKFSGHDFHTRGSAWRGWWDEARKDFVGLRLDVALNAENAERALLQWSAGDYFLAFRGEKVEDSELPEGSVSYILTAAQMTGLVDGLRSRGFMSESKLPATPVVWTADLRVDGARVMMRVPAGDRSGRGTGVVGAGFHRLFAAIARTEMWQQHRNVETQPDAAAFWRVERKWLDAHEGQENRRLIWHIIRRLPSLDAAGRARALADLQSVPGLPELITEADAAAMIAVAKTMKQIDKSDARLLEIALLAPGDLTWKNVLQVLDGRIRGAGDELATRLFRLLGPERVVAAIRHPVEAVAIAAMHDVAANKNRVAVPVLVKRMKDPDGDVQRTAIYALGMLHATAAQADLVAYEPTAHPVIRREIWGALGRIGGPGVPRILKRAVEQTELADKLAALSAMAHTQSTEVVQFLAARLVSQGAVPDEFSQRADLSLRQVGPILAIPALRPHLQMQDGPARRQLVLLLGAFSDSMVVPDLIELLRVHEHEGVAARFLAEITGVDLRQTNNRSRVMRAWYAGNKAKGQTIWYLDALRAARVLTTLQASSLTRRSGVGAVTELARLLVTVKRPHLAVMTAAMLRETTGEDFTRGVRYASGPALQGIADRYKFHAAAVRAAAK